MTDLLTNPLCRPEHLGRPIPDSPHAVSACLPTWADVVGYEQGEPRVIERMAAGYPRFVYHPRCRALFAACDERFADGQTTCLVFPTSRIAQRFTRFIAIHDGAQATLHDIGCGEMVAARFPKVCAELARQFWQHTGEGVNSRQAEAALAGRTLDDGTPAKHTLRRRIADLAGAAADDVYLFPTGMAAIFTLHRALMRLWPDRKAAQFGFPYVDTLKVIQKFGPGARFYPCGDQAELEQLAEAIAAEPVCGIFTELPSNPLLATPDLVRLSALARERDTPLIVDDTIATWVNVDALRYADVTVNSLTKSFSGAGDVAGGCLLLRQDGRFVDRLRQAIDAEYEDLLTGPDARLLETNSRDFVDRVARTNRTAVALVDHLRQHPKVERVYHPLTVASDRYEQARRHDGGHGSLLSIDLKDAAHAAPRFYDALCVCKGPNLGANYTLACPYTILAHYHELPWARSCGVSRWLVRLSVGLEDADDLIARCDAALA